MGLCHADYPKSWVQDQQGVETGLPALGHPTAPATPPTSPLCSSIAILPMLFLVANSGTPEDSRRESCWHSVFSGGN